MTEQHSLTHFPSQPWCKVQESIKDHRVTGKGKSKRTGKGKGKHVDVVETEQPQPSETSSAVLAIVSGDADESMDMVRPGAETWRLIQSIHAKH